MNPEFQKVLDSINASVESFVTNQKSMQTQVDAIDKKLQAGGRLTSFMTTESLADKLKSIPSVTQLLLDRRGRAVVNLVGEKDLALLAKTTILESNQGFQVTGVMPIQRIPGIVPEARQVLTIRNALTSTPTSMAVVDYVRVSVPMTIASPVPEASAKPENQLSFNSVSEKVRTLATWIPASKQVLDDLPELSGFVSNSIAYYVNQAEELQLLSGDGTGENLHGLIPQSSALVGGLPAGSTKIDAIGAAIAQITTAKELPPTFVVLNPADWWSMRLLKDTLGRYLLSDAAAAANLFDLTPIVTTNIAKGTFLVGSGNPAASEIRDRMEMQIEISTEHMDFFTKNLVAIRAEKRLCLVVKRPASYVTGSFAGLS